MRMAHALTTDELKVAYARQYDAVSREELDARRSDRRQPTIQELLRDKMNDKDYNPTSNIVPDLHHSYSEPRDLLTKDV